MSDYKNAIVKWLSKRRPEVNWNHRTLTDCYKTFLKLNQLEQQGRLK